MPLPKSFIQQCQNLLGADSVIADPERLRVYECDALSAYRTLPELVVLPESVEHSASIPSTVPPGVQPGVRNLAISDAASPRSSD